LTDLKYFNLKEIVLRSIFIFFKPKSVFAQLVLFLVLLFTPVLYATSMDASGNISSSTT